ncbi:bifunctional DNA primase/polymerase [Bifidobacterium aquikefiri]|uniref:bifunctional DNA primase/polymerase n=1 Tax=Bifidobacterium aquikefiri TaxID=1653207 RepID=UPI0039EC92FB
MFSLYSYSSTKIPNGPKFVAQLLLGLETIDHETSNSFIDRIGKIVKIPKRETADHSYPYADDGYAKALWDFRNDSLLLGDDNRTLYVRDIDRTGNNQLLDTWHAISNLETEYHVKTTKAYYPWNDQLRIECKKLDKRVKHGIKFNNRAYLRTQQGIDRITPDDERFKQPYELTLDVDYSASLAVKAVEYMRDVTADEHSAQNLGRMFATPLLEPYKHLTYVMYGDGGNGKGILLSMLSNSFPDLAASVDSQRILGGKRGSGGFDTQQETGKLIGTLWAYDEDADTIGIDQLTYLKKISTGDAVTARRIGENAVSFTPRCTFIIATNNQVITTMTAAVSRRFVYIRMRDGRRPDEFTSLLDFRNQYGAAPFIMASCKIWEDYGDNPYDDVSISNPTDVTDLEQEIINNVCVNGYAPTTLLDGLKRYEQRDMLARFGLSRGGSKWVKDLGHTMRILEVKDEIRFAPYRAAFERDRQQLKNQLDTIPKKPKPIEADPLPLPSEFAFNCAYTPADEQKVARNWKKLSEDPTYDSMHRPNTPAYAVIPRLGMAIIDMDMPKDNDTVDGWTTLNQEIGRYGSADFPSTYLVGTPSGGVHAYYALPVELMGTLKNRVHANGIPVDIRCENKGYVIGPGSHTSKGDYQLLDIPDGQTPLMPQAMVTWLKRNGYVEGNDPQPRPTPVKPRPLPTIDQLMTQPTGLRKNQPDLTPIPEGQRNVTLHDWAFGRRLNHPENEANIRYETFDRGRASGLSDVEITTIWNSIIRQQGAEK